MLKLHDSTDLAQRRRMGTKICRYLNCENIHLGMLHKTNAKSEKRTEFWMLRRAVTRYDFVNAKRRQRDRSLY